MKKIVFKYNIYGVPALKNELSIDLCEKTNKKTKQDLILAHCKNNVNQTVDFVFECSKINSGTLEKPLEPLQ